MERIAPFSEQFKQGHMKYQIEGNFVLSKNIKTKFGRQNYFCVKKIKNMLKSCFI